MIRVLSDVTVSFAATHHQPYGTKPHSHLWEVTASFVLEEDGRERQAKLRELADALQGDMNAVLGDQATNEGLARYLLTCMIADGCYRVQVRRRGEGLGATAELDL